jgi:hypothetical protein
VDTHHFTTRFGNRITAASSSICPPTFSFKVSPPPYTPPHRYFVLHQPWNIQTHCHPFYRSSSNAPWTSTQHHQFEYLDELFTSVLLKAEKKCKSPHHADWHPTLHHSYLVYIYWKIQVSSTKTRKSAHRKLDKLQAILTSHNIDIFQNNPSRPAIYQLGHAKAHLRTQRQQAIQQRQQHLTFRQEVLVLEGKKTQAAAVATIQRVERRARCFRKFHLYTRNNRSSGCLAFVLQPNHGGTLTRIQQPDELEDILFHRNRIHFAQAHGTPFTIPPLSTNLQFSGVTEFGESVLSGQQIESIPQTAIDILAELKRVRKPLSHHMSLNDMITGFSKWRESTSTSPSNKHLGIYKSIIQHYSYSKPKRNQQTTDIPNNSKTSLTALKIQNNIINLAISNTHTLERWKEVHNLFLEKTPGLPLLDKLRVIHIYEADWNLILKYFLACQLTKTACTENTVTVEQAGGRCNRSSSAMATKTVITHEICRLQRLTGAVIYNDAKACFDRIVENISNLTCMREGLPTQIASLHAQTLQQMRYHTKTQYGRSLTYNGHMKPAPFLGSGQGAGDSMARWGFLSDALIRAYNKSAQSHPIRSPISSVFTLEHIQVFVDDSHGIIIKDPSNPRSLDDLNHHNMQKWEGLLNTIGGKLEIS